MNEPYIPDGWLREVGFVVGNPFSTREAALEPQLVQYFIPPPGFDQLLGSAMNPRSVVLEAERGCGKTTARRAVEWNCRAGRPDGPILCVPHLQFSHLATRLRRAEHITVHMHINMILREALEVVITRLRERPSLVEKFTSGFRVVLAAYIHNYTDLTHDAGLDAWLLRAGLHSRTVNAEKVRTGIPSEDSEFLAFLGQVLNESSEARQFDTLSYLETLDRFIDIAELMGYKAVYVMIDRVDETEPMASDPDRAADLLEPLLSDLPLVELERLAFKLFVTPAVGKTLRNLPGVRTDRLPFLRISWNESELVEMLDRRVKAFSAGRIESLDAVCAPDLAGLVQQMASLANGSPRNMLLLGEQLLYAYHTQSGGSDDLLLTRAVFARAVANYQARQTSEPFQDSMREGSESIERRAKPSKKLLSIDAAGLVWRGDKEIGRLSRLQYGLLRYLCDNPNRLCTKDELIEAVYGEDSASDEMLDKLVQRLRKRIEPDPSNPTYVKTAPGLGYVLEQPS